MSQGVLSRQFINDALGRPVAVILPIEEYAWVKPVLEETGGLAVLAGQQQFAHEEV